MHITVKLHASLQNGRFEEGDLQVADPTPIRGLVQRLGIPAGQVGILVVNGRHARLDDLLAPEDTVSLFPPVGGG
jgi:molybdopterin converting factor small subunit